MRTSVVLTAPFSPRIACTSPFRKSTLTSFRAMFLPNDFVTLTIRAQTVASSGAPTAGKAAPLGNNIDVLRTTGMGLTFRQFNLAVFQRLDDVGVALLHISGHKLRWRPVERLGP